MHVFEEENNLYNQYLILNEIGNIFCKLHVRAVLGSTFHTYTQILYLLTHDVL